MKKKYYLIWVMLIFFTMVVPLVIGLIIGCSPNKKPDSRWNLPDDAVVIDDLGQGWIIFELYDNHYLMFRKIGYKLAITQIR